jgi:hypothetical protein
MFQEGNNQSTAVDRIEDLRHILERQQSRIITREDAVEIGESLITFFELLGENPAHLTGQANVRGRG